MFTLEAHIEGQGGKRKRKGTAADLLGIASMAGLNIREKGGRS